MIWRRPVWRSGSKSLLQCVQTWSRTTGNAWPLYCKQRFLYQILRSIFLLYQIHISCNKIEINSLKIIQLDFLDSLTVEVYLWWNLQISPFFVSGKPWEIGSIKYLFAPLYMDFPRFELSNSAYLSNIVPELEYEWNASLKLYAYKLCQPL